VIRSVGRGAQAAQRAVAGGHPPPPPLNTHTSTRVGVPSSAPGMVFGGYLTPVSGVPGLTTQTWVVCSPHATKGASGGSEVEDTAQHDKAA
jgi:hypothetical protein